MKLSGLFPFVLLALGTLALWAVEGAENAFPDGDFPSDFVDSHLGEASKAGACPPRKPAQCFGDEKPKCSSDWQCPHKKKCCLDTCGTKCLDPVNVTHPVKKKPGMCPMVHGQCLMLIPLNHCETDDQCVGTLKCCRAMCGKVCLSPVKA